jgi:uncharacterized protein (TIGR00255 family)
MTGYGRGESARDGCKVTVEVSSVNRKQSEIVLNLPRELDPLETRIREAVNARVARGRLSVRVSFNASAAGWAAHGRVNAPLARGYARELAKLGRDLGLPGPVTLDTLLRVPGVIQDQDDLANAERFWPAVRAALEEALAAMLRMRAREGAHLLKDLRQRVGVMRRLTSAIQRQAPRAAKRYRQQLVERLRKAGFPLPSGEDERLLKEVVLFADRADITEELTRLQSHFQQFDASLKSGKPVGRTLDFLAQEMNREVNTIGAKANDSGISRAVVKLKVELERFREQAQNLE